MIGFINLLHFYTSTIFFFNSLPLWNWWQTNNNNNTKKKLNTLYWNFSLYQHFSFFCIVYSLYSFSDIQSIFFFLFHLDNNLSLSFWSLSFLVLISLFLGNAIFLPLENNAKDLSSSHVDINNLGSPSITLHVTVNLLFQLLPYFRKFLK